MTTHEGIAPPLMQALAKRGYENLTSVQEAVIDPELTQADMLVSAQTGSGKTLAFGMAIAPNVLGDDGKAGRAGIPTALIIAPTRELALQVQRELAWLYEMTGATITACVGGMDPRAERRTLERGTNFVVGTPGRLRDHIERGALDLSDLHVAVLDEADEMLDLGFREDLEFILGAAPETRRTLLFSATVSSPIAKLAKKFQRDAVRITTINTSEQHGDIEYQAITVAQSDRENAIVNLLRYHNPQTTLIFCSTRAAVNHLVSRFTNRGFAVVAMSGELSQSERNHAMQALRDGRAKVCIATDVAARGIDLPNLDLVIHADLPGNPETLLHRSGRTGRAGRKGTSALIVPSAARNKANRLLKFAKIEAEWTTAPTAEDITKRDEDRFILELETAEPATEEELTFAAKLLAQFGPEKVASALVRKTRAALSAPEDLADISFDAPRAERGARGERGDRGDRGRPERAPRERAPELENGQWFVLSVGRDQRAEPRWLVPMLCKAGGLTKSDIGNIRIGKTETLVELSGDCAESFMSTVGPSGMLEQSVYISPRDESHNFEEGERPERRERSERPERRDRSDRSDRSDRGGYSGRQSRDDRPRRDAPKSGGYKRNDDKRDGDKRDDRRSSSKRDDYAAAPRSNRQDDRQDDRRGHKQYEDKKPARSAYADDKPARAKRSEFEGRSDRKDYAADKAKNKDTGSAKARRPETAKGPSKPAGRNPLADPSYKPKSKGAPSDGFKGAKGKGTGKAAGKPAGAKGKGGFGPAKGGRSGGDLPLFKRKPRAK